jgi:hypothetical protein
MPYQVKAGRVTAIAADEKEALEMARRLTASSGEEEASIQDIFGDKVDLAALKAKLGKKAVW